MTSGKSAVEIARESSIADALGSVSLQTNSTKDPAKAGGTLDAATNWNVVFAIADLLVLHFVIIRSVLRDVGFLRRQSTSRTTGSTRNNPRSRH